ncbi:9815_t:CDS:2 [Dentiscutata heterogama]|uniref:9815_t:CDS:1 n=1 Tax=Dentiscutata heterogama TaxID=1316150 RepID=A0ACA9KH20_9GLOM|nr:9815_t:CDS:2 [Dentiscutata heterogama]
MSEQIAKEILDDYKNIKMLIAYCYKKIDDEESAFKLYKEIANKNIFSQSDVCSSEVFTGTDITEPEFANKVYNTKDLNLLVLCSDGEI